MSVVNRDQESDEPRPSPRPARQPSWFEGDDEARVEPGGLFVGVVVDRALDAVLTYRVPQRLVGKIQLGQRVRVPLGRNGVVTGYCVSIDLLPPPDLAPSKIKDVVEILDAVPLIDARMLELTRWMAGYYLCSWGQALDAVVPAGVRNQAGTRVGTFLTVPPETRQAFLEETLQTTLTTKQTAAIEALCRSDEMLTVSDVCRRARCSAGVIKTLRENGLIHTVKRRLSLVESRRDEHEPTPVEPTAAPKPPAMTPEQAAAMETLRPALDGDAFAPFLIHGVTGSGKTEVYLTAIETGRGAGTRGDRASPRDQPDAADDPPVPPPVSNAWPCCTATSATSSGTGIGRASPRAKSTSSSVRGRPSSPPRGGWG